MIVFAVLLWAVFSSVALFYLVKYRVRVEVHFECGNKRSGLPVRRSVTPEGAEGTGQKQEIVSALVNLKVKERRAHAIAEAVCARNPEAEFDTLLREALREAA